MVKFTFAIISFQICLKRSKLRQGAVPFIDYNINEYLINNNVELESDIDEIKFIPQINYKVSKVISYFFYSFILFYTI